ncbi:hypothetical protein HY502_02410 [Candidatus Woesebacteria bacterium]|nr:hypothetical protein [Candidatus Woesebacteria bacterium]
MNPAVFGESFELNLGGISLSSTWLQAGAIIGLVFILLLLTAQFRRHLLGWSMKGAVFGIFIGFLLALVFEGFLIIGGKTALTELLGWRNPPKPVANLLEMGRTKLVDVLGVANEIPTSFAETKVSSDEAIKILQSLDPTEIKKVKNLICAP